MLEEWNFREILNSHLIQLLNQQKIYWTQRGARKWVKFGDECTAFFHANASIRLRKNSITSLADDNGQEHFLHDEKAQLLWDAFKSRMGTSDFSHMYYVLTQNVH
jgi:hypothetical protein